MRLKPSEIRYSQDSIGPEFTNIYHGTILDAFEKLVNGSLQPRDLGLIEVAHHNGEWVAFEGNRRLFLFKKLEEAGLLRDIEVRRIIPNEYKLENKFTTTNGGVSIKVRRSRYIHQDMNRILEKRRTNRTAYASPSFDYAYDYQTSYESRSSYTPRSSDGSRSSMGDSGSRSSYETHNRNTNDSDWWSRCTIL